MADIANLVIRIDTTDIRRAKTDLTSLATLSTRVDKNFDKLAATSKNSFGVAAKSAEGATNSFNKSNTAAANLFKTITRFTVLYYLSHRLADVTISLARAAEEFELLDKKLLNVTKDVTAFGQTFAMAQKVGVEMKTAAAGITRFAVATRNAFDVKQMLGWQEGLIKSARLVGTTQKEIQSGMIQITQAMSAGRLQGDEFRSVMENLPMLAVELRKSFQGSTKSLKELASQGRITNEVLIGAMERLNEKMKDVPGLTNTIDAEFAKLENSWKRLLHNMTEGTDSWLKQTVSALDWLVKKMGNVPINLARMEKEANTARLKEIEAELAKLFTSLQKQVAKDDLLGQIVAKSQMNALLEEQKELTEYFRKQNELKKQQSEYEEELKRIREEQEKNKQFTEEQKVLEALRAQVVILDEREKLIAKYQARLKAILAIEAKTAEAKALQARAIETQTKQLNQDLQNLANTVKSGGPEPSFIEKIMQDAREAEKEFNLFESRVYTLTSLMMDASPAAAAVYQKALDDLTGAAKEATGELSEFDKWLKNIEDSMDKDNEMLFEAEERFQAGTISAEAYARARKQFGALDFLKDDIDNLKKYEEDSKKTLSAVEQMWLDLAKDIERNVSGLFADLLKGEEKAWENFTNRIKDMFINMIADVLAQMAMSGLLSLLSGGSINIGGGGSGGGIGIMDGISAASAAYSAYMGEGIAGAVLGYLGLSTAATTGTTAALGVNLGVGAQLSSLELAALEVELAALEATTASSTAATSALATAMTYAFPAAVALAIVSGITKSFIRDHNKRTMIVETGNFGGNSTSIAPGSNINSYVDVFDSIYGDIRTHNETDIFTDAAAHDFWRDMIQSRIAAIDEIITSLLTDEQQRIATEGMRDYTDRFVEGVSKGGISGTLDEVLTARLKEIARLVGGVFGEAMDAFYNDLNNEINTLGDESALAAENESFAMGLDAITKKLNKNVSPEEVLKYVANYIDIMEKIPALNKTVTASGIGLGDALKDLFGLTRKEIETTQKVISNMVERTAEELAFLESLLASTTEVSLPDANTGMSNITNDINAATEALAGLDESMLDWVDNLELAESMSERLDNSLARRIGDEDSITEPMTELSELERKAQERQDKIRKIIARFVEIDTLFDQFNIAREQFDQEGVEAYENFRKWALEAFPESNHAVLEALNNFASVQAMFDAMSISAFDFSMAGVKAANELIKAAGGLEELSNKLGNYFDKFGTQAEKAQMLADAYREQIEALNEVYGTDLSTNVLAYKDLVQSILNSTTVSADLKVALLDLADLAYQAQQAMNALNGSVSALTSTVTMTVDEFNEQNQAIIDQYADNMQQWKDIIAELKGEVVDETENLQEELEAALQQAWENLSRIIPDDIWDSAEMIDTASLIEYMKSVEELGIANAYQLNTVKEYLDALKALNGETDDAISSTEELARSLKEYTYILRNESDYAKLAREYEAAANALGQTGDRLHMTREELADFIDAMDYGDPIIKNNIDNIEAYIQAFINLDNYIKDLAISIESMWLQLQTTELDAQIEKQRELYNAEMQRYEDAIAHNERISEFLESLQISELKNQSPLEQMNAAKELFNQAVAGGDADKATQYGQEYLKFAQAFYASSEPYSDIFASVENALKGMLKDAGEEPTDKKLEDLLSDKEKLIADRETKEREQLQRDLILALHQMALAKDASIFALAEQFGIDIEKMGLDTLSAIDDWTDKTVLALADYAKENQLTAWQLAEKTGVTYLRMLDELTDSGLLLKDIAKYNYDISGYTKMTWNDVLNLANMNRWSTSTIATQLGVSRQDIVNKLLSQGFTLEQIEAWDKKANAQNTNMDNKLLSIDTTLQKVNESTYTAALAANIGGQYTDNQLLHWIALYQTNVQSSLLVDMRSYLATIAANTYISTQLAAGWSVDQIAAATTAWNRMGYLLRGGTTPAYDPYNEYAKGTNFVPEDQFAFLHKGEAVIPAEYNEQLGNLNVSRTQVQSTQEIINELRSLKAEVVELRNTQKTGNDINREGYNQSIKYQKQTATAQMELAEQERIK